MPTVCIITLNHSNGVYNSGDTITGHVKLQTTTTKSIRGIHIKVSGHADVHWEERRSRTSNGKTEYYTVHYRAHEQYLNSITYVVGRECGDSFDLLPGTYQHTFNCELPMGLPTSCNESYGNIKYKVTVTIDRRLRFDNVFKKPFTVNHSLDLNMNLGCKLPISLSDSNTICCLCCCCGGGGEIRASLKLPYSGVVPGTRLPFNLFVDNDSNIDISNFKVKFKKVMTFESTTPSRKCRNISIDLDTKLFETVLRLTRKEFKGYIQLPTSLPCTQVGKCIRTQYYIKGKVYMTYCTSNIEIEIPVTVGSIPFIELPVNDYNNIPVITTQPTAPPPSQFSLPDSLPPVYKTLDLPTYDDAIQMADNNSDEEGPKGKNNYKKLLPTYSNSNSYGLPTAPTDDNNSIAIPNTAAEGTSSSNTVTTLYGWAPSQ